MELSPGLASWVRRTYLAQAVVTQSAAIPWKGGIRTPRAAARGVPGAAGEWPLRSEGNGVNAAQRGPLEANFPRYLDEC